MEKVLKSIDPICEDEEEGLVEKKDEEDKVFLIKKLGRFLNSKTKKKRPKYGLIDSVFFLCLNI